MLGKGDGLPSARWTNSTLPGTGYGRPCRLPGPSGVRPTTPAPAPGRSAPLGRIAAAARSRPRSVAQAKTR